MARQPSNTELDSAAKRSPWLDALADRFCLSRSHLCAQVSRRPHPGGSSSSWSRNITRRGVGSPGDARSLRWS